MSRAEIGYKARHQLGTVAQGIIERGYPIAQNGYVYFWYKGIHMAWGLDTDPLLLLNCETDQEFTSFFDLIDSV
jgi:hypothetical protein